MEGSHMVIFWILGGAALVLFAALLYCFIVGFYAPPRKPMPADHYDIPEGEIYEVFRDQMVQWIRDMRALPHEKVSITSFDGLTLTGKYFEFAPDAPIELMFHGYRGNAERDLSGGVERCFRLGRSVLLVDQRCSGGSDGHVITFGIHEYKDCLKWLEFMDQRFGPDAKIILTGISMGAATVMMAADKDLPKTVIGILADCGYSSPKAVIQSVIRDQMHLPPTLCYPFVKLAARLFGGFDLEETSPVEALKNAKVPVIFFHGESDDFVPCHMSRDCYEACTSRKQLVTIPNAGHGLAYAVDPEGYLKALADFFGPEASHPACR